MRNTVHSMSQGAAHGVNTGGTGQLHLNVPAVDLKRFAAFVPATFEQWYTPAGWPHRFGGRVGRWIGNVNLLQSSGYTVVLLFEDGTVAGFGADVLLPARPAAHG